MMILEIPAKAFSKEHPFAMTMLARPVLQLFSISGQLQQRGFLPLQSLLQQRTIAHCASKVLLQEMAHNRNRLHILHQDRRFY